MVNFEITLHWTCLCYHSSMSSINNTLLLDGVQHFIFNVPRTLYTRFFPIVDINILHKPTSSSIITLCFSLVSQVSGKTKYKTALKCCCKCRRILFCILGAYTLYSDNKCLWKYFNILNCNGHYFFRLQYLWE